MATDNEIFAMIADRRREQARTLRSIQPDQAKLASLCSGWTVHQVAAHLVMPFNVGTPSVVRGLIRHRGDFNKYSHQWAIAHAAGHTLEQIAADLEANAEHRFTPPGFGPQAPLTDSCVHAFDIGLPLDLQPEIPTEQLEIVLDNLISPKAARAFSKAGLMDGLHFEATDCSWSHGSGRRVAGPAWALMLALSARPAGLTALEGDGLTVLESRLPVQ